MLRIISFLLLSLVCISSTYADGKPYYHKVPAKSGDSVESLMKRYLLHKHDCNYREFYLINKLEEGALLIKAKEYFIPVLIYDYNGKSIRTTVGLDGWEQAVRVKQYNERIKEKKLRQQDIVTSNILWVPYHELHCMDTKVNQKKESNPIKTELVDQKINVKPPKKEKPETSNEDVPTVSIEKKESSAGKAFRHYPIFGKDHAYIPLKSNKLQGKVFYVVGGHGGPDSGAVGQCSHGQLCEDEYAYDVALRMVRNMLEQGAIAYMITRDPNDGLREEAHLKCDQDEYCWGNQTIPLSQKKRLEQRSNIINELYEKHKAQGITDQIVITIHIDSRSKNKRTDCFFYHYPGADDAKAIAKNLQSTLAAKYKKYRKGGQYHGTVTPRDLHMLREVKPTTVYIELGNIRNPADQKRFIINTNRQAIANWLFEGLMK